MVENGYGEGRCRYVATLAGLSYGQTGKREFGKVESDYQEPHRRLITGFALEQGVNRPVTCSVPMVEADLLCSSQGTGVVLANYTGKPQQRLDLGIVVPGRPSKIRSAERGTIPFRYDAASRRVLLSLPLDLVDFVVVK